MEPIDCKQWVIHTCYSVDDGLPPWISVVRIDTQLQMLQSSAGNCWSSLIDLAHRGKFHSTRGEVFVDEPQKPQCASFQPTTKQVWSRCNPENPTLPTVDWGSIKHLRWPRCSSFTTLNWIKQRSFLRDLPCGPTNALNLPSPILRFSVSSKWNVRDAIREIRYLDVLQFPYLSWWATTIPDIFDHTTCHRQAPKLAFGVANVNTSRAVFGKSSDDKYLTEKEDSSQMYNNQHSIHWFSSIEVPFLPRLQNFLNWLEPIFLVLNACVFGDNQNESGWTDF